MSKPENSTPSGERLVIHYWPEKILRKKCRKVTCVDEKIRGLLNQMRSLMAINRGVGLAANQAGLDLSLVTIEEGGRVFKLVNPVIVKKEGKTIFNEGCLSFPGVDIEVKRAKKIWVSALDENGKPLDLEVEGNLAVVFQHEIDHINGVVFIDRISFFKKIQVLPRLRAMRKRIKAGILTKV